MSWLIYQRLFIYILCFFWWLAWCATLCFVNGFRPRVATNDMVVIVCQCDNVWFPISMWSWTFDEGGILSGRQSAVICHQLNELLSRLGFRWRCYIHRSCVFFFFFFGLLPWSPHDLVHGVKEPRLRSNQQWDKSFTESLRLCSVLMYKKSVNCISRKDRSEITECGNLLFLVCARSHHFLKLNIFKRRNYFIIFRGKTVSGRV